MSEGSFLVFSPLPTCCVWTGALLVGKLPLNEHVCAYSRLDFVWWVTIHSFYLLYPLAVLWTGALLAGKLPLNEHVCAYSRLDFVWRVKIHSFYLLYPLAVLWTGTQEVSCLWINVIGMLIIGFCVMLENSFVLPPLPTCCIVNWDSGGKLPLNKHVWHIQD